MLHLKWSAQKRVRVNTLTDFDYPPPEIWNR